MMQNLSRLIEQVAKEKGINREVVIEALEAAFLTAAKKKFGLEKEIEARFNEELDDIELFQFKTVVEKVANDDTEITVKEAKKLDPDVEMGDSLGVKMDSSKFGRIDVQMAKQIIFQKVRDAERDMIYREFSSRVGEIISGIARRMERGNLIVDLGKTEAVLPQKEQIPGEVFRFGDRVQSFIVEILQNTNKGPQIVLSRAAPQYLIKLFETEVPEVFEGIVVIKGAARDPGSRAKIAVYSKDSDVDPVGACVGVKGSRVQNVVHELRGEKIDIIPWSDTPSKFVVNSLAPAQISKVILDERNHAMEIVVPDDQLALAIGKRGQNVRLASRLSGWSLDIVSEKQMAEKMNRAKASLTAIQDISDTLALSLYHAGYESARAVSEADVQELALVPGFDATRATAAKENAKVAYQNELEEKARKEAEAQAAAAAQAAITPATEEVAVAEAAPEEPSKEVKKEPPKGIPYEEEEDEE